MRYTDGQAGIYHVNNNAANDLDFGLLYSPLALARIAAILPAGWRIPDNLDWNATINALGSQSAYKSCALNASLWNSIPVEWSNSSGLSFVGAGYRTPQGTFSDFKASSFMLSSVNYNILQAYNFGSNLSLDDFGENGYCGSIRCVKDV